MLAFPTELHADGQQKTANISLGCKDFMNGEMMPSRYTADGQNINPPLSIGLLPKGTKSLALIVSDADSPIGTWIHWLVWNIPPVQNIAAGSIPGIEGLNTFNMHKYSGPCPPKGIHRYVFKIYALDDILSLPNNSTKSELVSIADSHIVGVGTLIGLYGRS